MDRKSPEWGRWIQSFRTYERSDPLERLLAQTEQRASPKGLEQPCLIFTGRSTKNGYAVVGEGRNGWYYGHRLVYERCVGAIPAEKPRLHHRCHRRLCLEVTHLEPVSASGHARAHGLGDGPCRTCGHQDWYVRPDTGARQCRECRRRRRRPNRAAC